MLVRQCALCGQETSNQKYCSRRCAASVNNKGRQRNPSKSRICTRCGTKFFFHGKVRSRLCESCRGHKKITKKVTRHCSICGSSLKRGQITCTRQCLIVRLKNNLVQNMDKRRSLVIRSLLNELRCDIGCSRCGWNEASLDFHHIHGRRVENPHGYWNLTLLCPNCHRLAHQSNFDSSTLMTLDKYLELVEDKESHVVATHVTQ